MISNRSATCPASSWPKIVLIAAAALCAESDRDNDRLRGHSVADSGLAMRRVEDRVRIRGLRKGRVSEYGDLLIKVRGDAGICDMEIAASVLWALTRSPTFRVETESR